MSQKFSLLYHIFYVLIFISSFNNVEAKNTRRSTPIQTSLVVDIKTGKILHAQNSKIRIYPASLTKLMTLYLIFEAIESGRLSMSQKLYVSRNAAKIPPCTLGLKAGEFLTVRKAILALIVKSANDVAITVAENIKGTEPNFVKLMNIRAHQLGMKDTHFKNASGWPHPLHKTTARDLARLAIALKRDYPQYYPSFSRTSFVFRGNVLRGHNKVTKNYKGAEGLKTGWTSLAGFNLATTASQNNKTLIAIVTGANTAASRDQKIIQLLNKHFDKALTKRKTLPQKMIRD